MKLISIKPALIARYSAIDGEVLHKDNRPTVLIMRLKYRQKNYEFAVPLRSNIAPATPKDEYFALPNRKATKERHHHGLHYAKMFPVSKAYYERYRIEGDIASKLYLAIIDKNEKEIVDACQAYLARFEQGIRPVYSTDIDALIKELERLTSQNG
ncbi:MAG: hypothetical protein IJ048_14175 [Clostridia bacterium]|nr:hypothetical protein [Clostridia bacterium]